MEGRGPEGAVYLLRTIVERSLEVAKDSYLCFTDCTRAFDVSEACHNDEDACRSPN